MDNKKIKENCARAYGSSLPISTKQSIEICSYIRGKNLDKAIKMLQRVLEKKDAVPYTRFNNDVGHKPGVGPGRYPEKSTQHILALLESVKANAQAKGLNTDNLEIIHLVANKANQPWRFGRHRRRKAKRTHVEIIVEEVEKKETKKPAKKTTPKKEVKEAVKEKPIKKESESKDIKQPEKQEKVEEKVKEEGNQETKEKTEAEE